MHKARSAAIILTLLVSGTLTSHGSAQDSKGTSGSLPDFTQELAPETTSFGDSRDVVGMTFKLQRESAPPGAIVPAAVILDIQPGWHIWTNEGAKLEGTKSFDGAIMTEVTGEELQWMELGEIEWPSPHAVEADLGYGPARYAVFEGKAIILVDLKVSAEATSGETASAKLFITFQACDDETCLMPTFDPPNGVVSLKVDAEQPMLVEAEGIFSGWAAPKRTDLSNEPAGNRSRGSGSRGSGSRGSRSRSDTTVDSTPPSDAATTPPTPPTPPTDSQTNPTENPAPEDAPAATSSSTFFGVSVPRTDGALGLLLLVIMSIAGGFVLNLTPCVLPVIPIKIMTISKHAETPGRALSLGLWMALGVFAFWLLIGLPVAFLTTFTDPSVIFGIWWVTLGIGLLIGLMGIGIMGLFNFQLPQSVYMVNPKADNAGGSFLFGVMTAVLGLPCFGFVAGALLAGTATLPAWITLVIFASIGLGMALPYLVLSAKPSLVDRIPRTGPASELVKQVMGLLLLAAAAYFVGSGLIGLTAEMPWVAKQIHWWAISFAMIIAGIWLCLRTFQITPRWGARGFWTLVALVFAFVPTLVAVRATEKAHETWVGLASLDSTTFSTKVWNPYTPDRFEAARKDGKIVVMDFTAEWCLNCKALKAAVLDVDPVKSRLADDPNIVTFTADNTSRNAPGWQLMKELGQTGIPLLAIWGPDESLLKPWQSNAYTATQVIDAISEREDPDNAQKK